VGVATAPNHDMRVRIRISWLWYTTENGVSTDKDEGTTEQQTTRHQNHLEDPRKRGVVEGDLRPADSSNCTGGS
jgi:hypothetical protein